MYQENKLRVLCPGHLVASRAPCHVSSSKKLLIHRPLFHGFVKWRSWILNSLLTFTRPILWFYLMKR